MDQILQCAVLQQSGDDGRAMQYDQQHCEVVQQQHPVYHVLIQGLLLYICKE